MPILWALANPKIGEGWLQAPLTQGVIGSAGPTLVDQII
jgi:hypothetical protein